GDHQTAAGPGGSVASYHQGADGRRHGSACTFGAEGKGQIAARICTTSFDDANEDGGSMTKFIPYLSEEAIERDAAALLHEYASARGVPIEPPIPIEDIVEKHLKLGIEFDDTHKLFGVPRPSVDPDILGAIFFDDRRIVIDETLDP